MSFHNVRLPVDVERGAKGGPGFNTTVTPLQSGKEQRNINWAQQRSVYDISYGIGTVQLYQDITKFFYIRRGKAYGFRFKDWADYQITAGVIGTGNGVETDFQIVKVYSDDGGSYTRIIYKPVASTVQVYLNGVLQTLTTHYTLDANTGIVTFVTPPSNGVVVTVTCEFDVPVRFDTDTLQTTMQWVEAGQVQSIPLVELRPEDLV